MNSKVENKELLDEVKAQLDETARRQTLWRDSRTLETAESYIEQLEAQCRSMGQLLVLLSDPETVGQAKKDLE